MEFTSLFLTVAAQKHIDEIVKDLAVDAILPKEATTDFHMEFGICTVSLADGSRHISFSTKRDETGRVTFDSKLVANYRVAPIKWVPMWDAQNRLVLVAEWHQWVCSVGNFPAPELEPVSVEFGVHPLVPSAVLAGVTGYWHGENVRTDPKVLYGLRSEQVELTLAILNQVMQLNTGSCNVCGGTGYCVGESICHGGPFLTNAELIEKARLEDFK